MTLQLRFERRGAGTTLVDRVVEAPFALGRVFDLGDGVATVFVQSVAGMIRGGERWSVHVDAGDGCMVRLVHVAALPVHAGVCGSAARVDVALNAGHDAVVEMMGAPFVLFDQAGLVTNTAARVASGGAVVIVDSVAHHASHSSVEQTVSATVDAGHCIERSAYDWPLHSPALVRDGRHTTLWWFERHDSVEVPSGASSLPARCGWIGRATGALSLTTIRSVTDDLRVATGRARQPQRLDAIVGSVPRS